MKRKVTKESSKLRAYKNRIKRNATCPSARLIFLGLLRVSVCEWVWVRAVEKQKCGNKQGNEAEPGCRTGREVLIGQPCDVKGCCLPSGLQQVLPTCSKEGSLSSTQVTRRHLSLSSKTVRDTHVAHEPKSHHHTTFHTEETNPSGHSLHHPTPHAKRPTGGPEHSTPGQ